MHLVTITQSLEQGDTKLAPGSYLVENVNAGQLLSKHPETVIARHTPNPKDFGDIANATRAPKILFIRPGGFGDMLFLGAVIRRLKLIFPAASISVACMEEFAPVFDNNPDVADIVPYPVPVEAIDDFDALIPLEFTLESDTEDHAVDSMLRAASILPESVPDEEKRCVYHLTDKERAAALSMFPTKLDEGGKAVPRLGIQVNASALSRTYSNDLLEKACSFLHAKGWELYFFGGPNSLNIADADRVVNLTARKLNFRQSAAVLATCDVVLAPDSGLCHLAGALDLPTVALYGSFPWQIRTAYHPKTFALQGTGHCAPCFHQPRRGHFPADGPCAKSGRCDVLASIKPGRVAQKVQAVYETALRMAEHRNAGAV